MWVSLPLRLARIPFLWSGGGGGDGLMRDPLVAMRKLDVGSPEARRGPVFNPKRGDTTMVSGFLGSRVLHLQTWLMAG